MASEGLGWEQELGGCFREVQIWGSVFRSRDSEDQGIAEGSDLRRFESSSNAGRLGKTGCGAFGGRGCEPMASQAVILRAVFLPHIHVVFLNSINFMFYKQSKEKTRYSSD